MRTLRWVPAAAAILLAIVMVLHLGMSTPRADPATSSWERVSRGTVTRVIPLAGSVASQEEASVTYAGPSTTVETVSVVPGEAVTSGETLATLADGVRLTAPFAGEVVAASLAEGALVPSASGSSIGTGPQGSGSASSRIGGAGSAQSVSQTATDDSITIAKVTDVEVNAAVSQADAHWIKVGEAVRMSIPGEPGRVYDGEVTSVNPIPQASGSSEAYPVTISLPVPTGAPRPWIGMSVQAYVTAAMKTGLTVPVAAVHQAPSGVWRVKLSSGRWQDVTLGLVGTGRVVVTSGLRAGESVQIPSSGAKRSVTVELFPTF